MGVCWAGSALRGDLAAPSWGPCAGPWAPRDPVLGRAATKWEAKGRSLGLDVGMGWSPSYRSGDFLFRRVLYVRILPYRENPNQHLYFSEFLNTLFCIDPSACIDSTTRPPSTCGCSPRVRSGLPPREDRTSNLARAWGPCGACIIDRARRVAQAVCTGAERHIGRK